MAKSKRMKLWSIRAGCNRVVGCLDWHPYKNLVAFGAHNFVALFNSETATIVGILNGHTAQVNCLKWIPSKGDQGFLVSGSTDKTLRIWNWDNSNVDPCILEGAESGVTSLAVLAINSDLSRVLIAACSTDVSIWEGSIIEQNWNQTFVLKSEVYTNYNVALTALPSDPTSVLMALGGTDSVIRLFLRTDKESNFIQVCKLGGHEDWIRGLDFIEDKPNSVLLASASQDRFVRIWKIEISEKRERNPLTALAPCLSFRAGDMRYVVQIEGVLAGHEDRIHSVKFRKQNNEIHLLSASLDRTMIVWKRDDEYQCWVHLDSVGDAGCSSLGYFTGVFSPLGDRILAHGFTGALHLWEKTESGWTPKVATTGHCGPVMDLDTIRLDNKDGRMDALLTVGTDQTTRITIEINGAWHEIARPQTHGHDFFAVASIPKTLCFASCSEEKVIRVFQAPTNFRDYLIENGIRSDQEKRERAAYGASVKALALTNTAVYLDQLQNNVFGAEGEYTAGPDFAPNATPASITGVPLEEHLSQNTLWPEIQKLYGHGDVVYSLAASPCGSFLASAAKSKEEKTSDIIIWSTATWTPIQNLKGHTLTVTRIQFSPSGRYLASCSRDRSFCVYEALDGDFKLSKKVPKAHSRIIWDISWSTDEELLATASRDVTVKFWKIPEDQRILEIRFPDSVTACAFRPGFDLIAVGLQNGEIRILQIYRDGRNPREVDTTTVHQRHSARVSRLKWLMYSTTDTTQGDTILASCSTDHSVRLFCTYL